MKTPTMEQRLHLVAEQLHTQYESLGYSARYPHLYFVYDPNDDKLLPELLEQYFPGDEQLSFALIDLLPLTIESFEGDEAGRSQVLDDPMLVETARREIVQLWADVLCEKIRACSTHASGQTSRCPALRPCCSASIGHTHRSHGLCR